ncbi:putative lipopolysaccharide heptosyltransferase III, partial [Dissulfurispira sp.]|uniref:putative lipopolysaccharide heptosyltransferase III n=1 Tax=Dissulfurispira sp. TaxID=2817609 RepID=UPI002FD9622C
MNFAGIKKILVIKLRHIGDVLLAVPVFRALKETFPDAHITALVNSGTEDVLKGNPLIDEILIVDRSIKRLSPIRRYAKEIAFLKNIRGNGFDMTVDLTGGDRAAIISLISGARYRISMKSEKGFLGKKHLITHIAEVDGRRHTVMQNLEVVSQYGISTKNLSIDFYIPEKDRIFIKRIIKENNTEENDIVVHVHPTSRWLFKCWKDEYMAWVIKWLLDSGTTVIVTSSPDRREMEKARRILSLVGDSPDSTASPVNLGQSPHGSRLIDLCGKTTIKQLGAISAASDLFFGVDSAPMHIAAAVGTPVVALFGPSGAFNWGPWDNKISNFKFQISNLENPYPNKNGIQTFGMHTVIQRNWECIPCGKDGCNGSKISKCLEDIKP